VIEAAIVRAHGGVMQAALAPQAPAEARRLAEAGLDATRVHDLGQLCAAPAFVAIAPVTPCALVPAATALVALSPGPLADRLPDDPV
jgi:fructose-1,6-bisphosphatase II